MTGLTVSEVNVHVQGVNTSNALTEKKRRNTRIIYKYCEYKKKSARNIIIL